MYMHPVICWSLMNIGLHFTLKFNKSSVSSHMPIYSDGSICFIPGLFQFDLSLNDVMSELVIVSVSDQCSRLIVSVLNVPGSTSLLVWNNKAEPVRLVVGRIRVGIWLFDRNVAPGSTEDTDIRTYTWQNHLASKISYLLRILQLGELFH